MGSGVKMRPWGRRSRVCLRQFRPRKTRQSAPGTRLGPSIGIYTALQRGSFFFPVHPPPDSCSLTISWKCIFLPVLQKLVFFTDKVRALEGLILDCIPLMKQEKSPVRSR